MLDLIRDKNGGDNNQSASDGVKHFAEAAWYSAVQPVAGVSQILNKTVGTAEWRPEVPKDSSAWTTAGCFVGTAFSFCLTSKLVGAALPGKEFRRVSRLGAALESGTTGALFEGMLPVSPSEKNFGGAKLGNMSVGFGTFAAMGGVSKHLEGTGRFGVIGARSIGQDMALHGTAGAFGGVVNANLDSLLHERKFATFTQMENTALNYAAFGAALGGVNHAFGRTVKLFKGEKPVEKPIERATTERPVEKPVEKVTPKAEPEVAHQFDRSKISQFTEIQRYQGRASEEAIESSNLFMQSRMAATPFRDGTHITAGSGSEFTLDGRQPGARHSAVVIDKAADPIYRLTVEDAHARFGHLQNDTAKLGEALSKYVAQTMNASKLSGEQLMADVELMLGRNPESALLLGEFVRVGKGMCLQQALLLKGLGESFGKNVTIRDGTVSAGGRMEHHTWTEWEMPGKTRRIFDSAQRANNVPVYKTGR